MINVKRKRSKSELAQIFAWLEADTFARRYFYALASFDVPPKAMFARPWLKYAKPANFDPFPIKQSLLHSVREQVNDGKCHGPGTWVSLNQLIYKVSLDHRRPRLWAEQVLSVINCITKQPGVVAIFTS
jgi:hypothetical protein